MLKRLRSFLMPPVFDDEDKQRKAALLHAILLVMLGVAVLIYLLLVSFSTPTFAAIGAGLVLAFDLLAMVFLRKGRVQLAGQLFVWTLWAFLAGMSYFMGGIRGLPFFGLALTVVVGGALAGGGASLVLTAVNILLGAFLLMLDENQLLPASQMTVTLYNTWIAQGVIFTLTGLFVFLMARGLLTALERTRARAQSQSATIRELQSIRAALESRSVERAREIERRAQQLQATAEVGSFAASFRDLDDLLPRVARLISDRFGYDHTGVFLLDGTGEFAILRAASSEGGMRMLERGHRLKIGAEGIVGAVVATGKPRIAMNVGKDTVYFNNLDLPGTRSELAMPLTSGGRVLGALDVQSNQESAFAKEDLAMLRIVADQLSIAIENARLFAQTQANLENMRQTFGETSGQAWEKFLRARASQGYLCSVQTLLSAPLSGEDVLRSVSGEWTPELLQASQAGEATQSDDHTLAVPVKIRDLTAGVIRLRKPQDSGPWQADEIDLIRTLTDRLSVALESARLYEETQRRAERERLAGEISAKVRATNDPQAILQTAARELRKALQASRAQVIVGAASDTVLETAASGGSPESEPGPNGHLA